MKIIIGTHHKTGVNFFVKFLQDLPKKFKDIKIWDRGAKDESQKEPEHWDIYFDHWSKWQIDIDSVNFKGIHTIRDPRSLIYSATLYHLRGTENWLHAPKEYLGGMSYYQFMHSLPTLEDQILFEMKNSSKAVIQDMQNLYKDNRFFHLKLEDISCDHSMQSIRSAFEFFQSRSRSSQRLA